MKLKFMSVLSRAFSLTRSGATVVKQGAIALFAATAISLTPVVVKAQTPLTGLFPFLSGVELTAQQKIQLADLGSQALAQVEKIVSPQQREQFRTALAQGKGFGEALGAMNITSAQQTQLQGVFSSAQTQLISTLTTAQRQKILENMRSLLQLPAQ